MSSLEPITCPRCQKGVFQEKTTLGIKGKDLDIIKYTCRSCQTGFYFEEQIITFLVLKSTEPPK